MTFYDFFQDERNGYEINQISRMVENAERRYQKVSDSAVSTFISCLI
jgi:hypothetical protein